MLLQEVSFVPATNYACCIFRLAAYVSSFFYTCGLSVVRSVQRR
jgi:hypothetical protein